MHQNKRSRLQAAGWKVGSVAGLLKLPHREALLLESRARLASMLAAYRTARNLMDIELARHITYKRRQ